MESTELYYKNRTVSISVRITLEENEERLKELSAENKQLAEEQAKPNFNKKQTDLNPDYFSGRW